jgi:hypothetical protein
VYWLSTNYQWVVAVVAMPIILILLKRWADSPKKTGDPAPPTAHTPLPIARIQKTLPNIKYIGAETVSLREDMYGGLLEDGSQQNAILIRFANEARPDAQNLGARVKAVLIYRYGQKEIDVVGNWLDEGDNVIDIEPDSRRHKLIAGIVIDGEFAAVTAKTFVAHRRTWHRSDGLLLKGFQTGSVFVQLTNVQSHDVLFENEFALSLNPLTITPNNI